MILTSYQLSQLVKRFPDFELSYETIIHKKVHTNYNIAFSIPLGKKYFVWYTFHKSQDVCYLLELNKHKAVIKATLISTLCDYTLSLGTILYGTLLEEKNMFVVEDIYYYHGIPMKKLQLLEKMSIQKELFESINTIDYNKQTLQFHMPVFWKYKNEQEFSSKIPVTINDKIGYEVHHIQYRALHSTLPYINVNVTKKITIGPTKEKTAPIKFYKKYNFDFMKPQHKYPSVFLVNADLEYDVYHLYAYGKHKTNVYYNIAYIPNYKTSVFLNSIFRNIRENSNLDYIEESEDEEEFENILLDKNVDLHKFVPMECVFHKKFKKWIPKKLVDQNAKIVHINKLVTDYYD